MLEALHNLIETNPKAQILRVTRDQAQELYDYLVTYHLNPPPASFEEMVAKGKLTFMGRKIEIYEQV